MTQWLPIETYPFDDSYALLRGGVILVTVDGSHFEPSNTIPMNKQNTVIGHSGGRQKDESVPVFFVAFGKKDLICYLGATEWLPLEKTLDDLVDDAYVNGLRIML